MNRTSLEMRELVGISVARGGKSMVDSDDAKVFSNEEIKKGVY